MKDNDMIIKLIEDAADPINIEMGIIEKRIKK